MRLIIDDSAAFNQLAGIGRYARHVVPALMAVRPGWDYCLTYAPDDSVAETPYQETMSLLPAGADIRRLPLSRRRADQLWFRARLPLPINLFVGQGDAIYSPDFTAPPAKGRPEFITIHDLAFLVRPDLMQPRLQAYLATIVPRCAQSALRVLTVSEASRRDVVEALQLDPAKVVVVPNGVDERFFTADRLSLRRQQQIGVTSPFILCVGTIEPRKNHQTLFAAMRIVQREVPHQLVVAGRPGWDGDAIIAAGRRFMAANRLQVLHDVSNLELPALYATAAATVYPSWYEGFGLPVLESLAAGIPTVVSDVPALREIGGQVVIPAAASEPEVLAAAILQSLGPIQDTNRERERRQERAREYSWHRAGESLASAIECAIASR